MSAKPNYEFNYITTSGDADPSALLGSVYWYESGATANSQLVYYSTDDAYAYWYNGVDWIITLIGEVDGAPAEFFVQSGTTLTGVGAWQGSLEISEHTISDAWWRAETEIFDSLRAFVGARENVDCFRGFLPVKGDSDEDRFKNVWMLTSGGSGDMEMTRLYGANANWCSLRADVRIESFWDTREQALKFSGAILAWLKSTNNFNEVGNVQWCTLADIPDEPIIERTDGRMRDRNWRQTINLELVYATGGTYN